MLPIVIAWLLTVLAAFISLQYVAIVWFCNHTDHSWVDDLAFVVLYLLFSLMMFFASVEPLMFLFRL